MALRPVEIAIRAKDQTKAGVQSATTGLERFAAAQARTYNRRRDVADMENAAFDLAKGYRAAADRANELGQKIAAAKRPSKALRDEFVAIRDEARRLKTEAIEAAASVGRIGGQVGARGSFAQFDQIAIGAVRAEHAIEGETAALNANTAALGRNALASGRKGKADLASRITGAAATRNQRGPLGLRPYELQNLSYQVNDFFTQIASGTPVTQAFAQQFGQVAQLFPKAITGFVRFIPLIGLATIALSPFVAKLVEVNNEAKNLDTFEKLLKRSGEAASYNAEKLAVTAKALDKYGASADEARAALTQFVTDSVDPAYLQRFGEAAIDTAKALEIDLTDAVEKVSTAFTGNADAILALDDELNFLTDAERAHIVKLKESKREAEARTYAFEIFERQMDQTSGKMKGPWSQILSDFGGAWRAFANWINFIDFSALKNDLNIILGLIARVTALLPGARSQTLGALEDRRAQVRRELAHDQTRNGGGDRRQVAALQREDFQLGYDIAQQRNAQNRTAAPDTTLDPPDIAAEKEKNARSGESDAEKAAERRAELLADLRASNEARAFELSLVDSQEREAQILTEIEGERLKFAEENLTLTDLQTQSIRDSVGALYDANKAKEAQKLIDQASLELAEAREQVESRDDYVERKIREAGLYNEIIDTASGELAWSITKEGQEYAKILRLIYDINDATRQRTEAEAKVNDLVGLRSDLMEQIQFYEDAGQSGTADALREQLVTVNDELRLAVDNAINFWTAFGGEGSEAALLRLGLLRDQLNGIGADALFSGKQINDMIAQGGANAFDQFAQSVAEGANVIASLRDAFLQFAADFLNQIAQMIIQQAILNALQASQGGGGGAGGGISGFLNGLFGGGKSVPAFVKHAGGVIGNGGPRRSVPSSLFAGAMRYHTGGVIGLKPNERSVIAQVGEEMLTEDDPRHRNNLGSGKSNVSLKNVTVIRPADLAMAMVEDEVGQRVLLNFLQTNARAVTAAISP